MKVTFILRNLTDSALENLAAMTDYERFQRLIKWAYGDLKHCVSVRFGTSNSFGERVRVNTAIKDGQVFKAYRLDPRRGYKLATFEI